MLNRAVDGGPVKAVAVVAEDRAEEEEEEDKEAAAAVKGLSYRAL